MSYKLVKIILAIVVVVVLPISKASFAAIGEPKIKIVTKDSDLGQVEKNKIYDFKIEVRNVGTEDLVITNVTSSCGCLELTDKRWSNIQNPTEADVTIEPVVIGKGNSIYISARVDTNKVSGEFEKTIHVFSNDPENNEAMWTVRGVATPSASRPGLALGLPSSRPGLEADRQVIMVFYSPGCNDCREIRDNFLPEIQQKYKDKIMIVNYNIENMESYAFMLSLQDKYDKKPKGGFYNSKPPVLFIEDRLLYGAKNIKEDLEQLISRPGLEHRYE